MSNHSSFWSESRWGRAYGYRPPAWEGNPYSLGYHIAQDIMGGAWFGPVPTLRSGEIIATGRSGKIGGFVSIRADEDRLIDTYSHLYTGNMPSVGTRREKGNDLPRLARSAWSGAGHEYMGSASTGPHCHFTVTRTRDGAYNPRRGNDVDPRPIIRRALSGESASGGARPFDPEENDMSQHTDQLNRIESIAKEAAEEARQAKRKAESAQMGIWQGGKDTIRGVPQDFKYGVLPIVAHSQATTAAQLAGLTAAIQQLAASGGGAVDLAAVQEAAKRGADEALSRLVLRAES